MREQTYIKLIASHVFLGFFISLFPFLSKIYAILILIFGLYFIVKNKNHNNEALLAAAYITGAEVLLRTTAGNPIHEYGKYMVILFVITGMFFSGKPKKANPYWIYLALLIPSIFIGINTIETNVRKKIIFDILGPICLGICSLYTYKQKSNSFKLNEILLYLGLPIVTSCFYLLLTFPITQTRITNTESNIFLSGNYAPNQMATILGLGTFIFFLRTAYLESSRRLFYLNLFITCCIFYRGLLTFSRGGTITGIIMIIILVILIYSHSKNASSFRPKLALLALFFPLVFAFASYQSDHLLTKRYINQNPSGEFKSTERTGREEIALEEVEYFKENPLLGVGVGESKEFRRMKYRMVISNHSEVTRLMAEHGLFGIVSLIILIVFPLLEYYNNKKNLYLLCFFAFWLLTINHSGMRVAAPALVYALALLHLKNEKDISSV